MSKNNFLKNIKISAAELSDIDMLIQFLLMEYDYNRGNPAEATPDFFGLSEETIVKIINSLPEDIQDESIIFLLVKSKIGHILGWGQVSFRENDAELVSLYLAKPARNRGFGDLLLTEVLSRIHQRGYKKVITLIQKTNLVAKHFLERHNFKIIETFDLETEDYIYRPVTVHKFFLTIE